MKVVYIDKRGAGCMRSFSTDDTCIAFISKLKAEARVLNDANEKIGSVERDEHGISDDKRVKWLWWYEKQN